MVSTCNFVLGTLTLKFLIYIALGIQHLFVDFPDIVVFVKFPNISGRVYEESFYCKNLTFRKKKNKLPLPSKRHVTFQIKATHHPSFGNDRKLDIPQTYSEVTNISLSLL